MTTWVSSVLREFEVTMEQQFFGSFKFATLRDNNNHSVLILWKLTDTTWSTYSMATVRFTRGNFICCNPYLHTPGVYFTNWISKTSNFFHITQCGSKFIEQSTFPPPAVYTTRLNILAILLASECHYALSATVSLSNVDLGFNDAFSNFSSCISNGICD